MRLLVAGTIHKAPTSRATKNGDPMTFATLRIDSVEPTAWVNVTAFKQQAEVLAKLKAGDSISVSGKVDINLYEAEGKKPRPNISLLADQLTTLKRQRPADYTAASQEKPSEGRGNQSPTDAKIAIAEMVHKQFATRPTAATGNCLQCGQELVKGLCISCPF